MKKYTFRNYMEYLKDNPKDYWFKRRLYGWGWAPANLKGWIVVLVFLLLVFLQSFLMQFQENSFVVFLLLFLGALFIEIIVLVFICYKTGEKPRWTWGR